MLLAFLCFKNVLIVFIIILELNPKQLLQFRCFFHEKSSIEQLHILFLFSSHSPLYFLGIQYLVQKVNMLNDVIFL